MTLLGPCYVYWGWGDQKDLLFRITEGIINGLSQVLSLTVSFERCNRHRDRGCCV